MISSRVIEHMLPLFDIISRSKGKTIGQLKTELGIGRDKMVKGASGLIVENLLGIRNNNRDEADIPEIGCEIKILPLQRNRNGDIKAKEPTAIQMINYMEVSRETWETAKLRSKINLTFWVVYLAKKDGATLKQDDYVIVDYFLDHFSPYLKYLSSIAEIFSTLPSCLPPWKGVSSHIPTIFAAISGETTLPPIAITLALL